MYAINFSGVIGDDVTAAWIRSELKAACRADVQLDVNSPGGSVVEGREIQAAIRDYPGTITARVVGQAASMASVICCTCSTIAVRGSSIFMLHRVSGGTLGNAADHRKSADVLDKMDLQIAADYSLKSGKPLSEIMRLMDDETWLFGREILDAGFADVFIGEDSATDRAVALAMAKARFKATWHRPGLAEIAALAQQSISVKVPFHTLWKKPEPPKAEVPENEVSAGKIPFDHLWKKNKENK